MTPKIHNLELPWEWRVTAAHRQRMRVSADPDAKKKPKLLLKLLADSFSGYESDRQTLLVQQLMGCAITRSLWRHRVVALFLGASNAGKSTLLAFLSSFFAREHLSACNPQKWDEEYYVAALATSNLNVVGDLDKKDPIPGSFKNVVGKDLIQGRHPTHRPFAFVCTASHFFNSNHTPPTADHSDAFFNRWRIVYFANSVNAKNKDLELDKKLIEQETGSALYWALQGAASVIKNGGIIETQTHLNRLKIWRRANNSALMFIDDQQECDRSDPQAMTRGQNLFEVYRVYARDAGVRAFGRTGFYEALADGGVEVIARERSEDHQVWVKGVALTEAAARRLAQWRARGWGHE